MLQKSHHSRLGLRFRRLPPWFVLCLMQSLAGLAWADSANPLQPIDTSSPRATLQGFVSTMNEAYEMGYGRVQTYLKSPQLFLSAEDFRLLKQSIMQLGTAERAIDFSALPAATASESTRRLTMQLKEVLDHIELPPWEAIPDAAMMKQAEFKHWIIPGTEIRLMRIESGPRAGEYLFSAETVNRLPEFLEKVQGLPYQPNASLGLYLFSNYSPAGIAMVLHDVVPSRWLLNVPGWAMWRVADQPLWRWFSIGLVLASAFGVVWLARRLGARCRDAGESTECWGRLLFPLSLMVVTPLSALILGEVVRVTGWVGKGLTLSLWTLFYLALTWLVWASGSAIAESVIQMERLRASSIDSQLIRLALRLVTTVLAIAILVVGADRIGLPAYSVVAGLGVGGLAVALAGQQTLANLLGSLIIMFEKPFSIGDLIKVGDTEGVVEDVGFRSTRIRTLHDSLVTIPSSHMVNSLIDNMDRREHREVKTVLNITYDTPPEKISSFVAGIRNILENHPGTRKDNLQIGFFDFGPHSLNVLVKFLIKVPDRLTELAERDHIMREILLLAEAQNVKFAFPTQSVYIEGMPENQVDGPRDSSSAINVGRIDASANSSRE